MIDPEAEEIRRSAFTLAMHALDIEVDRLRRARRLGRWLNLVLVVCIGINVGSVIANMT